MAHKLTSIRNIFLTNLCRMESSTLPLWTGPFPTERVSGYFLLLSCLIEISISNINSIDPDHTPRSVESDLSLHCLPMSLL